MVPLRPPSTPYTTPGLSPRILPPPPTTPGDVSCVSRETGRVGTCGLPLRDPVSLPRRGPFDCLPLRNVPGPRPSWQTVILEKWVQMGRSTAEARLRPCVGVCVCVRGTPPWQTLGLAEGIRTHNPDRSGTESCVSVVSLYVSVLGCLYMYLFVCPHFYLWMYTYTSPWTSLIVDTFVRVRSSRSPPRVSLCVCVYTSVRVGLCGYGFVHADLCVRPCSVYFLGASTVPTTEGDGKSARCLRFRWRSSR